MSSSLSSSSSSSSTTTMKIKGTALREKRGAAWRRSRFPICRNTARGEFRDTGFFSIHWREVLRARSMQMAMNGAAEDITKANGIMGYTPCIGLARWPPVSLPVVVRGGRGPDIAKTTIPATSMHRACYGGHLSVCQWLFEVGAAGDIAKTNNSGYLPCIGLARWPPVGLPVVVRGGRGRRHYQDEQFRLHSMHIACEGGHLSVCQWLFEVGAAGDIAKTDDDGYTPSTWLAGVATGRSASGCSRWARPETSPRRTMMATLPCIGLAKVATCRSAVVVRGGRGRRHHQDG